jgi:putative addiction module killer protein
MIGIVKSATFDAWLSGLRDRLARARIQVRITRLSLGNPGDVAPIGKGLSEMRVHYGPGYRVCYMQPGMSLIVPLNGGIKRTQAADIRQATRLRRTGRSRPPWQPENEPEPDRPFPGTTRLTI